MFTDGSQHSTKTFLGKRNFALFIYTIFNRLQVYPGPSWSTKTFQ